MILLRAAIAKLISELGFISDSNLYETPGIVKWQGMLLFLTLPWISFSIYASLSKPAH